MRVNLPEQDNNKLTKLQEIELVKSYAKKQGFENNQWIAYKHNDTKNPHYHFIANRINADTAKSNSVSNDRFKNMDFSKSMEIKYNLFILDRKPKKDKSKTNSRIKELKRIVDKNILKSKSFDEFIKNLENDNVAIKIGRGLAYRHDKVSVKGSDLGRNYSLKKTQNRFIKTQKLKRRMKF